MKYIVYNSFGFYISSDTPYDHFKTLFFFSKYLSLHCGEIFSPNHTKHKLNFSLTHKKVTAKKKQTFRKQLHLTEKCHKDSSEFNSLWKENPIHQIK